MRPFSDFRKQAKSLQLSLSVKDISHTSNREYRARQKIQIHSNVHERLPMYFYKKENDLIAPIFFHALLFARPPSGWAFEIIRCSVWCQVFSNGHVIANVMATSPKLRCLSRTSRALDRNCKNVINL